LPAINRSCCTTVHSIQTRSLKSFPDASQIFGSDEKKTHSVIKIAKKIFIPIDDDVATRHGINDGDPVSLVEEGIGRLVFQSTKRIPEL